ncbi:hypothetical protein DFQ05_1476 [Winogradskyella wandonensis]|uniref:Lipoprotein n=1 Tax=Winogradskyella wandonensis TaxID=1442586 RepID=A0A4R1KRN0_9FLAO|nr:hypothetical protein [Winogradskyella wandonensis]TCK67696.1 hypothetical protein DFQ05_1476 [Winogradskyella wandonensis]
MMNIKYLFILLGLFVLMACGDKMEANQNPDSEKKSSKKEISVGAIEHFKYNDYILSSDAEREVREWPRFQELETQISFLKKADVTFFTAEKDTLKAFMDSLRVSVPKIINTTPVNARITALETKLLKLNNDLTLDNYSAENKLSSIKDLLIANSNLIFVINKKLEFDKNDVGRPEDE